MNFLKNRQMAVVAVLVLMLSACIPTPNTNEMAACEKESMIMQQIADSEYETYPDWSTADNSPLLSRMLIDFVTGGIAQLTKQFLSVTVGYGYDQFPEDRTRSIHNFGSVAAVKFVADESQPFDGFYQGAPCGVVRLSLASAPSETNSLPGMGLKFFVDDLPSVNFVAMSSLDAQEGHNFFKNEFTNFLTVPENGLLNILADSFRAVTDEPFKVDVTHLAQSNGSGTITGAVDAPEQIYLVPNKADLSFAEAMHEVRDDLASIPVDTVLYSVWGRRKGETEKIYIGDLVTKSEFVASTYGDHNLFFRHETVD